MNNIRTTIECDVLVVGAGPAGSTAARVAALGGARVLLVERKPQIGVPEQCAGYVARAIRRHVDLPPGCVAQSVDRLRTWLPDGTCHEAKMPGYILNRAALDRYLALQAVKAGARLALRTAAVGIGNSGASGSLVGSLRTMQQGGSLTLTLSHCDGRGDSLQPEMGTAIEPVTVAVRSEGCEMQVRARVVIGADGPRSAVARWMGVTPGPLARAAQYEVVMPRRIEEAEVFFSPAFRGGYAWLFPAGEAARVGAAFDGDPGTGLDGLRQVMEDLRQEGRITESAISYTSGFVPVGGQGPVRRGNVLLAGDAGAHTHPITGAGIVNAIVAGEMAGRAAARAVVAQDTAVLDEYEEEFQMVLGPALSWAREKRSRLDLAWDSASDVLSRSIRESWIAFDEYYCR